MASYDYTFPGVEDVALTYVTLSQYYIINGFPGWGKAKSSSRNAPYRTGNLFDRIGTYNSVSKMLTFKPTKSSNKVELPSVLISLNFAPPGAKYGYFVHEGKGSNTAIGRRPFAEVASKSTEFKRAVNKAITGNDGPISFYQQKVKEKLDKAFKTWGKS